jgi:PadR family transcriptional regulator PadR
MGKPTDLVQGTLDLLILKTLLPEQMYRWAIAKRIQQLSGEVLQVQSSLYPAAHRLKQQGWIKAKWAESETGRQAKFHSLTTPVAPSSKRKPELEPTLRRHQPGRRRVLTTQLQE